MSFLHIKDISFAIPAAVAAVIFVMICIVFLIKKISGHRVDEMDGYEFEKYCAACLREMDFEDVSLTPKSGDFGVDIVAKKEGVTYGIQCKRYDGPVGVTAVEEVYAGRDYYDLMVGAVMTNSVFTPAAQKMARKLKILLWDKDFLRNME